MKPAVLLVNPPVYDFSAYDFWLRPYGLLRVGGMLRGPAEARLFDFMDRASPLAPEGKWRRSDAWGRGEFYGQIVEKPRALADIPRRFRRYGVGRKAFADFLAGGPAADFVLIGTMMTYWYLGVREVIEDVRRAWPGAKIVLGGIYATLCADHARGLGADLVVEGEDLGPLWRVMGVEGDPGQPPLWEAYEKAGPGAIQITRGCPFRCSYCSVPLLTPTFSVRPTEQVVAELELMVRLGCRNVAFYDDALLHQPDSALRPLLDEAARRQWQIDFHTPNALHARLLTRPLAERMVRGGFRTFYVGFESRREDWQRRTGGKLRLEDMEQAAANLAAAGAPRQAITAYVLLGHPRHDDQDVAGTIEAAAEMGVRVMLAEFSPIPGTPDAEAAGPWTWPDEPLSHNKTAFSIRRLGFDRYNRLKALARGD